MYSMLKQNQIKIKACQYNSDNLHMLLDILLTECVFLLKYVFTSIPKTNKQT